LKSHEGYSVVTTPDIAVTAGNTPHARKIGRKTLLDALGVGVVAVAGGGNSPASKAEKEIGLAK
jgi:hypothetical protein